MKPLSVSASTNNLRKAQTNDILHSLLKEIDKYNETQVRQKVMLESYETRVKNSLLSDKRSEDTALQSITLSPPKKGDQSPSGYQGGSDQSAFRSVRESKDYDMKRCKIKLAFY